ncbi:uncharacterized protein LOC125807238 [Solanum verrucosum]|uniref:uncharacterized protein LOC125807238 n=1 Tax=Solanum verrucosum TaxID=315347 RepID=UPI0020D0EF60|nr:uncharacterized protein LOC125807238 [Solanum verrucosum]
MSMEEMVKKIMADQTQLAADVRNNMLATQKLEKQFGQERCLGAEVERHLKEMQNKASTELANRSVAGPKGVVEDVLVQVGSLILPVDFVVLNFEPELEILRQRLATLHLRTLYRECTSGDRWEPLNRVLGPPPKPSIEEAPKMELKALPAHLRYSFLGEDKTLPIILSATLSDAQVEATLIIMKKRKIALGWQMSDIHGISPALCMHKIYMEEGHKSSAQHHRRLNPLMNDVVRKEVIKWLDAGIVYPILGNKWVSPVQCAQERRNESGYNQIVIAPEDQKKITFTCLYAFKRMPFGLCNAPTTFKRCMMSIFHDMVELFVEVFMDEFSVFGESFELCLTNLDRVLARCEETNLVLNWEKYHFLVRERIVLGHKISKSGLEVDKSKVEVIEKFPPRITVKGVRSFLGHVGFYRRFIKDFSKTARPMCSLLEKEMKFVFNEKSL